MDEFKEVLNNNLDSYELYRRLNNKDDYNVFHINIINYVLDREGIDYEVKPYSKYMLTTHAVKIIRSNETHYIFICWSLSFEEIIIAKKGQLTITRETTYEELREFLINE